MDNQRVASGDEHLRMTILGLLIFLGMGSLFKLFQNQAMDIMSTIAWYHVKLVLWLTDMITFKKDYVQFISQFARSLSDIEPYLNPDRSLVIDIDRWWRLHQVAGRAFFLIYLLPTVIVIRTSFGRRPDLIYRTRHNLESLWENQPLKGTKDGFLARMTQASEGNSTTGDNSTKGVGYLINPLVPRAKSDSLEPALNPEEWLVSEGLVTPGHSGSNKVQTLVPFDQQKADEFCDELTFDGISEVFEDKFGNCWQGFACLKNYEKGLVAAQILHYDFQQDLGMEVLMFLAATFDVCHPDEAKFDQTLGRNRWYQSTIEKAFASSAGGVLEEESCKHAWKCTALVATLRLARKEGGVLPTACFLWLKLVDRTLWYTLNNAGNAVSSVESAGVHAHYRAEIQSTIPLIRKNVFQVSRSFLEDYLSMNPKQLTRRKLHYELTRPIGEKLQKYANTAKTSTVSG